MWLALPNSKLYNATTTLGHLLHIMGKSEEEIARPSTTLCLTDFRCAGPGPVAEAGIAGRQRIWPSSAKSSRDGPLPRAKCGRSPWQICEQTHRL